MEGFAVETLGIVAGVFTTGSFVPQVVRIWRTRSTRDISFRMYLIMSLGIALWMVYGLLIGSLSVLVANGVSLGLTLAILGMKVAFERRAAVSEACERRDRS